MRTPKHVVQAAFEALAARDYNGLASLCDPLSLRSFKQETLEEYCGADDPGDEDLSANAIELTDEEYEDLIDLLDPVRHMQEEFPFLETIDQLKSTGPAELFAMWMYARSAEYFLDRKKRRPWESSAEWDAAHASGDRKTREPGYVIIGCVFDTPDIAHVLYRNEQSALEVMPEAHGEWLEKADPAFRDFMIAMHHRGDPIVITCRRQPDGAWLLVARKHFMLFGSFEARVVRPEDEV